MNPTVRKSIKKKHKLFKKFLDSENSWYYKQYIEARNEAAKLVKEAKRIFLGDIANKTKTNPKTFWRYVNSTRKTKDNVAPLTTDGVNFVTDSKGKADRYTK